MKDQNQLRARTARLRLWSSAVVAAWISCTAPLRADSEAGGKWWHEAPLRVGVHGHTFDRVTANNVGCQLRLRLYFAAPPEAYQDERNAVRNHYRMRARVKLGERVVLSPEFKNSQPGRRVYAFSHDTEAEGCWAKQEHRVWKLDVNACRGSHCAIEAFD